MSPRGDAKGVFLKNLGKAFADFWKMRFEMNSRRDDIIRERDMKHIALMFGSAALVGMSTMALAGGHDRGEDLLRLRVHVRAVLVLFPGYFALGL